jgi:hypothetical protein
MARRTKMEPLILKGFSIVPCGKKHATHDFYKLPERLCKKLVDSKTLGFGRGKVYGTHKGWKSNGFDMRPVAALQHAITRQFGDTKWVRIEENNNTQYLVRDEILGGELEFGNRTFTDFDKANSYARRMVEQYRFLLGPSERYSIYSKRGYHSCNGRKAEVEEVTFAG